MSVEATGWAFRQKVPAKPKMVLMALADQTDETTGRVCYGKTDMAHLADKSSVPERSLARYISALAHNGYIIRVSGRDPGGRQRANSYWLVLDRATATDLDEWRWPGHDQPEDDADGEATEPQDVEAPSAILAVGEDGKTEAHRLPSNGSSPTAIGGSREESTEVPLEPSGPAPNPNLRAASGFSRKAQDAELENRAISEAAAKTNTRYFVIEGSRAWQAWIDHRRDHGMIPSMPTCTGVGEFANRRGWWMPSLFPHDDDHKSTDPPQQTPAT